MVAGGVLTGERLLRACRARGNRAALCCRLTGAQASHGHALRVLLYCLQVVKKVARDVEQANKDM